MKLKLGLVSAILEKQNFEQMIDEVHRAGLKSVEVACWPVEKAARRYAGVAHIDTETLTDALAQKYLNYAKEKNVTISALAYYPNPLDEDLEKRERVIRHLYSVIDAAALMDINLVTTFLGRMPSKTVAENIAEVKTVWPKIIEYARDKKVRIAIENCPMLFTADEWPGGQNLMTTPKIFREVFAVLDYDNFGLNYDPSHFVWQQIDYIKPLYEFKDKLFHIHFKDIKVYADKLADCGIMATPLEYMSPKLPGLGDVDWGKYVSALTDIGYTGYTAIEVEDKAFETSDEDIIRSIHQSTKYLQNFVI